DDRLRLVDGRELAFKIHVAQLLRCDVAGVLHHLERPTLAIEDGVVARLDPDLLAALADPLVLTGVELAAPELLPELAVIRGLAVGRIDEHAVMLADNLIERVAERVEEVLVRRQHLALERELDDGLRPADRRDLPAQILHIRSSGLA